MIDNDTMSKLLVHWVKMDAKMRLGGQEKVEWTGSINLPEIGERIALSDVGCVGTVCDYNIIHNDPFTPLATGFGW